MWEVKTDAFSNASSRISDTWRSEPWLHRLCLGHGRRSNQRCQDWDPWHSVQRNNRRANGVGCPGAKLRDYLCRAGHQRHGNIARKCKAIPSSRHMAQCQLPHRHRHQLHLCGRLQIRPVEDLRCCPLCLWRRRPHVRISKTSDRDHSGE